MVLVCFELCYLNHSKNSSNKKILYFLWFFLSAKEFLFFLIKSICCGWQVLISFHSSLSLGIMPLGRTEFPTWIPGLRPSGGQRNMFYFFPENSKVILSFSDFYLKSICWKYSPFLKFPFFFFWNVHNFILSSPPHLLQKITPMLQVTGPVRQGQGQSWVLCSKDGWFSTVALGTTIARAPLLYRDPKE